MSQFVVIMALVFYLPDEDLPEHTLYMLEVNLLLAVLQGDKILF